LKEQPDLNWRNPEVQEAVFDAVRFWLERGVDGFRVDVAHYIMKDPLFRDNPATEMGYAQSVHRPLGEYDSQIHINDKGHPDVHRVYRDFRKLLDEYSLNNPRMSIGEIHIFEWKEWASYYGKNLDELHMPYNFSLLGTPWNASAMRKTIEALEANIPEGAWPNYVLGNHDESRVTSRIGEENAPLAAMMLLTLRGTPTIYYGDEIGMLDVDIPLDQQKDPAGIRQPGQGRDMCRTPMQWNRQVHAGFSDASTDELWLPLHPRFTQINVETQLADPTSLLNLYRQLLSLRKKSSALRSGTFQSITSTQEDCLVYLRELDTERVLIVLNISSDPMSVSVPMTGSGKVLLSTTLVENHDIDLQQIPLKAREGKIIRIIDGYA
jgi:glycosidase